MAQPRDAAFYRALGEETFAMAKRLTEIAAELQNVGEGIAAREGDGK